MNEEFEFFRERDREFKDTEIGEIPKEWSTASLSEVGTYINGYPFKSSDWKKKGLPIIRIQNLNDPTAEFNYFDGKIDDIYIVNDGDILLSWSATLGVFLWKRGKAVLNQHIFKVVPTDSVNKTFLYYAAHMAIEQLKKRIHGSTMRHFTKDQLDHARIPLPLLSEQQKIAEVLFTIDQAIQKTNEIISKLQEFKKGLMQRLLTKGIGHTRFKRTEIGEIPEEWEVVRLGDQRIAKIIMGQSPPSSTYNKNGIGLPFLQGKMEFGDIYPNPSLYCSEPLKVAEKNDVLISVRAPVGEVNLCHLRCCIGRGLAAIRANPSYADFRYLFYYLRYSSKRLLTFGAGSTFKAIGKEDLKKFTVALPSLSEQRQIVDILSSVEQEVAKEKQINEQLEKTKKWFMNNLLTGKIRIKVS
jgi:type I restriction enzyme S subunit